MAMSPLLPNRPGAAKPMSQDISKSLTRKPGPDSVVSALIEDYRPPVEPFPVTLSRGQVLYFRAVQDSAEWAKLKRDIKHDCDLVKLKRGDPTVWKAASQDQARNALAFLCHRTMDRWYTAFVVENDEIQPEGEALPAWSLIEWLTFADKAPTVFDGIAASVDSGQTIYSKVGEGQVYESEKKG